MVWQTKTFHEKDTINFFFCLLGGANPARWLREHKNSKFYNCLSLCFELWLYVSEGTGGMCVLPLRPSRREEFPSKVQSFGFPVNMLWCSKPHKEMITTLTGFMTTQCQLLRGGWKAWDGWTSLWLANFLLSFPSPSATHQQSPWRHSVIHMAAQRHHLWDGQW